MAEKIVIASGKGGVGKTSVTVALAKAFCAMGKKVLVVDCDCLRSVDIMLGTTQQTVYDWGDIAKGRCETSQAVYTTDDPNLSVLSSPESYDEIDCEQLKNIIVSFDEQYDYIFIDAPAGIDTGLKMACTGADRGIVVSTADLVCVRSACIAARKMNTLGIENVRLIINRLQKKDVRRGRMLNFDSVIDSVEVQLIGIIPEDMGIKLASMGGDIYKKGRVSYKAINNIAKRIQGEQAALEK